MQKKIAFSVLFSKEKLIDMYFLIAQHCGTKHFTDFPVLLAANRTVLITDARTAVSILLSFFLLGLFSWNCTGPWRCEYSTHREPISCDPFWSSS